MENIKVAVVGARGKMGSAACRAITQSPDLDLVAEIGRHDDLAGLKVAGAQVAVELSTPDSAPINVNYCVDQGIHCVVGTTGWTEDRLHSLRQTLAVRPQVGVLIAPNFAIGAVLTMRFAAAAARYFDSAEVVEIHHPHKVDAPSGTARHTAKAIAAAREQASMAPPPDATVTDPEGARGAMIDGIRVHALRMSGLVAHEEVLLSRPGELLTIRHDSFDRECFMPGIVQAVRTVPHRPGLTVGLEHYLDV